MSTLKDKLKKLSFFTHHPKEHEYITYNNVTEEYLSKEEIWDEWFNSEYINGKWYLNEGYEIVNQYINGQPSIYIYKYGSSDYSIRINNWKPNTYHSEQNVTISNDNDEYNFNSSSQMQFYTDTQPLSSHVHNTQTIPPKLTHGTVKIKISPYYDTTNNKYYQGIYYTFDFANITEEAQNVNITLLDVNEDITSPILLYESPTNSPSSYTKINSATLSWDTNGYYVATNNGSNTFESVILPISNCPTNLAAEVDINYQNNGSNIQPRFGFLTNSSNGSYYGVRLLHSAGNLGITQFKDGTDSGRYGHAATLNYNTWYKLKIIYKNGYFYSLLYDSNGQLNSSVGLKENITPIGVAIGLVANNNKVWFKNLKIYEVD